MDWKKLLSVKRISEFSSCLVQNTGSQFTEPRSRIEKDCDQIIFSNPVRRLEEKTQVIPFPEYDFVHTRLTHSQEVASVGRSLGKLAFDLILPELVDICLTELPLCRTDIGALECHPTAMNQFQRKEYLKTDPFPICPFLTHSCLHHR